jgi:hypothetical protein
MLFNSTGPAKVREAIRTTPTMHFAAPPKMEHARDMSTVLVGEPKKKLRSNAYGRNASRSKRVRA